jgi:hypothetical protein
MKRSWQFAAVIGSCFLITSLHTMPAGAAGKPVAGHAPNELLVKFKPGAGSREQKGKAAGVGRGLAVRTFKQLGIEHWTLPAEANLQTTMENLRASDTVEFVEPNYRRYLRVQPATFCAEWALADMQVDLDGDHGNGAGAHIAVIDTGVDVDHPALLGRIVSGADLVDGDDDPEPDLSDSDAWHGTGVTSAAVNVARSVSIVAIRTNFYISSLLAAYDVAIEEEVDIVNASWGGPQFSIAETQGVAKLEDAGILLVAAAGNADMDNDLIPDYPSSLPNSNVLAVAAGTQDRELTRWSQHGARSVDIAAPGVSIWVAEPVELSAATDYRCASGTSFSAPHVAGLAALVKGYFEAADFREIKARIIAGAGAFNSAGVLVSDGRASAEGALSVAEQPVIVYAGHSVSEPEGNGNGVLEPGEHGQLLVRLENLWQHAGLVSVRLRSDDETLVVPEEPVLVHDFAQGKKTLAFDVRLAADGGGHRRIPLTLDIDADGIATTRRFRLELGALQQGVTTGATVQSDDQDDMHVWTFHLTSPVDRLSIVLNSAPRLDLLVRRGGTPEFNIDCYRDAAPYCVSPGTLVSAGDSTEERLTVHGASPGVYHVAVVDSERHAEDVGYTIKASVAEDTGGGSGGGGSTWLLVVAAAGVLWQRRLANRVAAAP